MQRVFRRGLGPRVRSFACDGEDHPDPYGDYPEFVEAILDGAGGGEQKTKRRSPRR